MTSVLLMRLLALFLTLSPCVVFAADTDSADQRMAKAHEGRAKWTKFPGFTAEIQASSSGQTLTGTIHVDSSGKLTLTATDPPPWVERTLSSVIGHRLSDDGAIANLEFADDDAKHPLGRLLKSKTAGDENRWRVKGDVLTEVHRHSGKSRFTITVTDVHRNKEYKHLPRSFSITTWNAETNAIETSRQVYNEWTRIGHLDLPTKLLAVNVKNDGTRGVEEIVLSNHQLLSVTASIAKSEELAQLKTSVTSFGAAMIGDELFVYGGHTGNAHKYHAGLEGKELQQLNLKSGKEFTVPSEGPGRTGLAAVAHGGKFYRIGGFYAKNGPDADWELYSSTDFACYDPQTKKWTDLSPLPKGRSSHDAVVLGDKVYVFGGWELSGAGEGKWHAAGCVYDLAAPQPKWENLPDAPFFRRALAVAAFENKLYVIGGIDDNGSIGTKVGIFDPSTSKWSEGPPLPGKEMDGFGASAVGTSQGLFATTQPGTVFRLTKAGDTWEVVGALKHPRFFHRLVAKEDGTLVVVGGTSRMGKVPSVEVFTIATKEEAK